MSAADPAAHLHPFIVSAAAGELPPWAECKPARREHARRVAELMDAWSGILRLGPTDRMRWRAAAILHDALRDADPASLTDWSDLDWPSKLLHGPACATRLIADGVDDPDLLDAITYHTVGNPRSTDISDFLYMADFLEPGRRFMPEERAAMRERLPDERRAVLREVAAVRIAQRLEHGERLLQESVDFWNRLL